MPEVEEIAAEQDEKNIAPIVGCTWQGRGKMEEDFPGIDDSILIGRLLDSVLMRVRHADRMTKMTG